LRLVTSDKGATYQIDEENDRVRRVQSSIDLTPLAGPEGQWKSYRSTIMVENRLVFVWEVYYTLNGEPDSKSSMTNDIVEDKEGYLQ
jgi:hypothetical protein